MKFVILSNLEDEVFDLLVGMCPIVGTSERCVITLEDFEDLQFEIDPNSIVGVY